jgi:tetratricopeptide (TPR) repeat protein
LLFAVGDSDGAQKSFERSAEIREMLAAAHPDVLEYRLDLANSQTSIGAVYYARGQYKEALPLWERAATTNEALTVTHPEVIPYQDALAGSLSNLGAVYQEVGMTRDALRVLGRAVEVRERLAAVHPTLTQYQRGLVTAYGNLNETQIKAGHWTEALGSLRKVRKLMESITDPRPEDFYTLACTCARSTELAGGSHAQAVGATGNETEGLSNRAMEALRRAIAAGYKNRDLLDRNHDLDSLRLRADFQALMMDVAFPSEPFSR